MIKIVNWGVPLSSVGKVGVPHTDALSSCSSPGFKSHSGALCCVSLLLSLILFPAMSVPVLSIFLCKKRKEICKIVNWIVELLINYHSTISNYCESGLHSVQDTVVPQLLLSWIFSQPGQKNKTHCKAKPGDTFIAYPPIHAIERAIFVHLWITSIILRWFHSLTWTSKTCIPLILKKGQLTMLREETSGESKSLLLCINRWKGCIFNISPRPCRFEGHTHILYASLKSIHAEYTHLHLYTRI